MAKGEKTMWQRMGMACVVVLICVFSVQAQAAVMYTVTDLGTLGQYSSYALGMSEAGHVVGRAELSGDTTYFRAEPSGTITNIPITQFPYQAADTQTDVSGVNRNGDVLVRRSKDGINHAFVWQSGAPVEISNPTVNTYARALNDHGQVVGSREVSGEPNAFVYDPVHGMQPIPGISLNYSNAFRISSNGIVLGQYTTASNDVNAFLYDTTANNFRDIGLLGSRVKAQVVLYSTPRGLNDFSQVVADGFVGDQQHAVYWDDQHGLLDMGTLGGDTSFAYDINSSGIAVGISSLTTSYEYHGYLWTLGGGMEDLNTLLSPESSSWTIVDAGAINNGCQIAGTAYGEDGAAHAVLLTLSSVPEPSSLIMSIVGSLAIVTFYLAKHKLSQAR